MSERHKEMSAEQFDYMRCSWSDMHGISKSKVVPKKDIPNFWKNGVRFPAGVNAFGPTGELVMNKESVETGFGNDTMTVIPETLHAVPWAATPDISVGQVLLEWRSPNGEEHGACPRSLARRQLQTLKEEFGLTLMSAFEHEFILMHQDTEKPVYEPPDMVTTLVLAEFEGFLLSAHQQLSKAGVDIEALHTESSDGQFEAATSPKVGIAAFDQSFLFKLFIKEISRKSGYMATLMTRPSVAGLANGAHFNHSLWNDKNENVFYDAKNKDNMSDTFKHWIAGLIKHTAALSALCNPTVNCYRRLYQFFIHKQVHWGLDNRFALYRAKTYTESMSYLENRMPTGAANPYVICAGVVAAGMDGLRNKLELPPPMQEDAESVPMSLEEALNELDQDKVMRESLGKIFVDWFLMEKRSVEVETFKYHNMASTDDEQFARERKMYLKFL